MIKTTKVCNVCHKEKSLREFKYRSNKCNSCNTSVGNTKAYNKKRQQIFNIMREWHKDGCNNDCENCGFHSHCQEVLDVLNDTNWSEGEE
ncbi:hypothetical protein [Clostridium sp. UBA4395]|uniref:hypothetical protein n=1 Tax=Clostridium sp. UBA4395 TaxID=1946360 RepID=UPI003216AF1A